MGTSSPGSQFSYLTPSNGPQWFASAQVRSPGWRSERLWASLWSGSCVKKLVLQMLDSPRIIVCKDDPGTCDVGDCHGVVLTASRSVASHNACSSPSAGVCFVRVLLRNRAWTQDVGSLSGHTPDSNAPARSPVYGCSLGIAGRLSPFYRSPPDACIASARTGSPVRAAGHPVVGEITAYLRRSAHLLHRREERRVRFRLRHLVQEQLHGLDRRQRGKNPAQYPDARQIRLVEQ